MIHPTRTNLLALKEKARSVSQSTQLLKARRQALMREFYAVTAPFLRGRHDISAMYGKAVAALGLSLGIEGEDALESIARGIGETGVEITEKNLWGLRYKEVAAHESPGKLPDERGYDYRFTTPHLEASIHLFEKIVESIIEIAAYESKLKRLGDEIMRTTRTIRILQEKVKPELEGDIKSISQHLEERERETRFRLKLWKESTAS